MELKQYVSQEVLFAAATLISTYLVLRWWNQNRKLPPGPWGLPFLGYFPFVKEPTHIHYTELSKKYGNVFSFRTVGGQLFIVLNTARVIKEVMVNRADEFIGRIAETNLVSWLSNGLGITQEEGDPWKEHRKFFQQESKSYGFGKMEMEEEIHDEVRKMLADIREEGSKPFSLHLHVCFVTNTIISRFLFNKTFKKDENFARNLSDMWQVISTFIGKRLLLVGFAFNFFFTIFPTLKQGRDHMKQFTDPLVTERIQKFNEDNKKGFVDAYLQQKNEIIKKGKKDGGTFTDERLKASVLNLYFEGTASTGETTVALIMELSRHPQVQRRIQEELDEVVGFERLPSWADRPQLPYLDATIQELYRTQAQFLVTTIYSNFKETTIEGFRIPERSAIVANLWTIHMDPEIYPEPSKFDPKRFLNSEGKRIKREGPYPFGLGKRSCIGESLAQMEVFLIISAIMQSFTLQPVDEEHLKAIPRR